VVKKRNPQASATANVIPDLATLIPQPSLNPDGSPPPANLLPSALPTNQPLRLFNRGLPTEHYGFYNYFDRNIFLKTNTFVSADEDVPADENGGSTQVGANVRCTWSNTRFLVQIWTKKNSTSLLAKASSGSKLANGDFIQPGSFPYPVTITMDRHGGDQSTKMLYCWGMDVTGKLNTTERQFQLEDRSFGGTIIDPSAGVFGNLTTGPGIDGGSGGCSCKWQNF
jgi:hypothetical protein